MSREHLVQEQAFRFIEPLFVRRSIGVDYFDAVHVHPNVTSRQWLVRGIPAGWLADPAMVLTEIENLTRDWRPDAVHGWTARSRAMDVSDVRPGMVADVMLSFPVVDDKPVRVTMVGHLAAGWLMSIDGIESTASERRDAGSGAIVLHYGQPDALKALAARRVTDVFDGFRAAARDLAQVPRAWWSPDMARAFGALGVADGPR